nr:MltA domain-containing protein [Desulfobacterales bacterium]
MRLRTQTGLLLLMLAGGIFFWDGCLPPKPRIPAEPEAVMNEISPADWPDFADDMDYDGLIEAINQSLTYLSRIPDDRRFRFGRTEFSKLHMYRSLELFRDFVVARPDQDQLQQFVRQHYQLYRSIGRPPESKVLFTGYFEPLYPGSLEPSPVYTIPVYGIPDMATYKRNS